MKKFFRGSGGLALGAAVLLSCLNPPHDNKFDSDNPDKAAMFGRVTSPEGAVAGAYMELILVKEPPDTDELYDTVDTDDEGKYALTDVDPGIYRLNIYAEYFSPVEIWEPETLVAGEKDTLNIYLCEMLFNFDADPAETRSFFTERAGAWEITADDEAYSWPNVYRCAGDTCLSLLNRTVSNYGFGTVFNIHAPSDTGFIEAGLVLSWQDSLNYYLVALVVDHIRLAKVEDGTMSVLAIDTSAGFNYDTWHDMHADVHDGHFEIFFDGELKLTATDNTFTGGYCGIEAGKLGGAPVTVDFDDVRICR